MVGCIGSMRLQRVQDEKVVHVESAKRKGRKRDIGHVGLRFAETVVWKCKTNIQKDNQ